MADGQTHRARTLIEANTPIVDAEHLARMNLAIDAKEGIDPRTHLEDLYRQTGRTVDLQNLASYLSSVGDATALRPLTLELFRRVQTVGNALNVVTCLTDPLPQWTLWLRLADPNVNNASSARSEIQQRMSIGVRRSRANCFRRHLRNSLESHPLQRHLYNCKQFGGLDDNDLIAEFMLARTSMSPRRLYSYVEQHHTRLSKVLSPAFLLDTQVDALMADGQTHRARTLIEANTPIVDAEHLARMNLAIDAKEGIDPRTHLEDLYRQTGRTVDLQNLASYLSSVGDATALRPLTLELFRRVQTVGNALNVVTCLTDPLLSDYPAVLCFLETNRDLVHHSPDLASANAWALFMAGRLDEAKQANDSLLSQRQSPVDFYLDTRISLASGSWERLGEAIDREWPRRRSHDQPTLLYMAWLASQASDDP